MAGRMAGPGPPRIRTQGSRGPKSPLETTLGAEEEAGEAGKLSWAPEDSFPCCGTKGRGLSSVGLRR